MKKKSGVLKSDIEKLENEVKFYHDLDALINSYKAGSRLSDKDIFSVLERIKYQILIDSINNQSGIKDKLDRFTQKWNLFSRPAKTPAPPEPSSAQNKSAIKNNRMEATAGQEGIKDTPLKKKKKWFQLRDKKKESDKLFNKLKRKIKVSRCENCGYFYVHNKEKSIFQCTFFEFSSQVDKKDVCENWIDNKKFKQPFF